MNKPIKDIDIKKFLPHRDTMLMVDELIELSDSMVKTQLLISKKNIFVEKDYFVESGLLENIAQTCSIIVGSDFFDANESKEENNADIIGFISGIKSVNIYKKPKVNDLIISKGILLSRFDTDEYSVCTMYGEIKREKELLLECKLNLIIKKVEK